MRSKGEIVDRSDFMKFSAKSFIENEKQHGGLLETVRSSYANGSGKIYNNSKDLSEIAKEADFKSTKSNINYRPAKVENDLQPAYQVGVVPNYFPTKRYVTSCYLKCVVQPVWFRESVFLKIGSTKRKYDESVLFKCALVPTHWKESVVTDAQNGNYKMIYTSTLNIPVEKSEIHYISFEPQQIESEVKHQVTML